jgi:hypothetical protein
MADAGYLPNFIRTRIVDAYADYVLDETDRAILVHTAGVTITLPASTLFQEGKVYSITNKTDGGFRIQAAEGELIFIGSTGLAYMDVLENEKSRDFQRHNQQWDVQ